MADKTKWHTFGGVMMLIEVSVGAERSAIDRTVFSPSSSSSFCRSVKCAYGFAHRTTYRMNRSHVLGSGLVPLQDLGA